MKRLNMLVIAVSLFSWSALGSDWIRWRGPNLTGVSSEAVQLVPWTPPGPKQLWKASVGVGFSSVSVKRDRVYTMGNRDETDTVFCLDANTGEVVWEHSYPCGLDPKQYEGGPSVTPALDGEVVYTLSKSGHLFCLEAGTGKVVWEKNLPQDFGLQPPSWGFAGSPLVEGDKLLLNAGERGLALNKASGQVVWSSADGPCGYATPVPYDAGDTRAVLIFSHRELASVAVADGRLLWRQDWRTGYDINCPDPIVRGQRFFVSSYDQSGKLLEIQNGQPSVLWQNPQIKVHLSPGVAVNDSLYAFHGDAAVGGQLKCVDLESGSIRWSSSLAPGALIAAGDKLIILSGRGELILAEATLAAFTPLARTQVLQGRCWTMPVLSAGKLYVRNAVGDLVCLEMPTALLEKPQLAVEFLPSINRLRLTWAKSAAGFRLESVENLGAGASWSDVLADPVVEGDLNVLSHELSGSTRFFRLKGR